MFLRQLDTPALLVDLDIMERNLRRAAEYARAHDLRLRPHTKTHKVPELARLQLELGAAGLTVAKVGEAEVLLAAEPPDLLVAYPVIGRSKLERLVAIARRTRVTVMLDSLHAARQLSDAAREGHVEVGVLAEMDVGLGRTGVTPGEQLVDFIRGLLRLPHLRYDGIGFYPGHIRSLDNDGLEQIEELDRLLDATLERLRREGLAPRIVSGGSTPTLYHSHRIRGLTEIRPGTYIFNDRNTWLAGACKLEDCAASILVTVVSTSRPGQVIVDGGSKTFSSDRLTPSPELSFGYVLEAPGAVFTRMNEEHGYLDVRRAGVELAVGDRLRIIPNHICAAVNLHEKIYGVRGDRVEEVWQVAGRGKLQ
ncbi:MAG: alanine racemase [Bryobacterales bacterium]|nr:alanine racemase [Bryobacteraceae bacterium]MDW8131270.1 alanine racemase [Bryobacterales bacterium]